MNLAVKLTAVRLLMGPLFFLTFVGYGIREGAEPTGSVWHPIAALLVLIVSEVSDWLDGWIARRRELVTEAGALMDGFADSLARLTFLTCFWFFGRLVPPWMVLLAYYHDALGFFLRNLARGQELKLVRRLSGRIMEGLLAAIAPVVVGAMLMWHAFNFSWNVVEGIAWWGALAVGLSAVCAAVDYIIGNASALRRIPC